MRTAENKSKRFGPLAALLASAALLLAVAAPASAAGPEWRIDPLTTSTAAPEGTISYRVQLTSAGTESLEASVEPFVFTAKFPNGLTPLFAFPTEGAWACSSLASSLTCENTSDTMTKKQFVSILVAASVDPSAAGILTAEFEVTGGGAAPANSAEPVAITSEPSAFGIRAFAEEATADPTGTPSTQAGGRPYAVTTSIDFNSVVNPIFLKGSPWPAEPVKDIEVDLPPGLVGNPAALTQCTLGDLSHSSDGGFGAQPLCAPESQVGTIIVRDALGPAGAALSPLPVFNLVPPADAPARLGFNILGTVTVVDVRPRSNGDYGFTADVHDIPGALAFVGNSLNIWGVPADPIHTPQRACPGKFSPDDQTAVGPTCESNAPQTGFWRNPTSCEAEATGLQTTVRTDSWFHPGVFDERTTHSHLPKGYPYPESEWGAPQGPNGCSKVKFEPSLEATPTTTSADSPSGLDVNIHVPQECWSQIEGLCQSDLRDAEVILPQGMTLNPSASSGLQGCTPAQIGLSTPVGSPGAIHFNTSPPSCPHASKIGSVDIVTPLLGKHDTDTGKPIIDSNGDIVPEPLTGSVYLAQQQQNSFGSLLAMYLVAEGSGVVIKQAGEIRTGPGGRMTTVFKDAPQQPFSDLEVDLFGGPRAPLRTPPSCGTFAVGARFTPWSGNATVTRASGFEIDNCPNSSVFDPKLTAGTQNPLAGAYSPFTLRLTRDDGSQELAGLEVTLPEGLIGAPKDLAYCPDSVLAGFPADTLLGTGAAQESNPSCPAGSRVGTVTVGAGAGPNPFYTASGRAYLAGPYKGAPLSLAVIAPAVAGPFDLGTVLVRNAVHVNPETTQISVASDPLPSSLHGIPLDLRDVRVNLDRTGFTLNPTSCDPTAVTSTVSSAQGSIASPSSRFQVAGCDKLGFKPKLSLKLKGGTKRSANPALTAVLKARPGDANIGRVQVALPHSEFLAQGHIRTICTRVQFAADACPAGSIYGKVTATSPILGYPLYGNVYLRSSDNPLPDMVLALRGPASQPIQIDAVGRIDSINGGIRTTFATIPDAPLTKVVLKMPAGKKSLLENSTNLCRGRHLASVRLDGQNGKAYESSPALRADCRAGKRGKG